MSIKSCFSSSNKRLQELYDDTLPEKEAAVKAINAYHKELNDKLNKLRSSIGVDTIPSEDIMTLPPKPSDNIEEKLSKVLSKRIENSYEKFYGKLPATDTYTEYLDSRPEETLGTAQDKINRLQQALDVLVITDNTLEGAGALLPSNHPLALKAGKPVIAINPNKLFGDTVFHEFGHLYISLLGRRDQAVEDAIDLLRNTPLWKEVADNYPELNKEQLEEEVLATALGIEGDKLFKEDVERKTLWDKIKFFLLNAINKLLGNISTPTALEQLATEMFNKKVRLTGVEKYNSVIAKFSKYTVDESTQENADKIFKALKEDFTLNEETHKYKDKENNTYQDSVSTIAKSLTRNYVSDRKKSLDMDYDDAWKLTEENWKERINHTKLPAALYDAINSVFRGEYSQDSLMLLTIDDNQYWDLELAKAKDIDAEIYYNIIEDNLDLIHKVATENQATKNLPLVAGNIVHDAIEEYINKGTPFPDRLVDRTGKLLDEIKSIVDTGRANGSKFYPEQMLFSKVAGIPGTADLIEITKDGKFRIYDWKTTKSFKKNKRDKNDYQLYASPGYLHQVMIYSTILEEYGLEPADNHMNILVMEVDKTSLDENDDTSELRITDFKNDVMSTANKTLEKEILQSKNSILKRFINPKEASKFNLETRETKIDELVQKISRAVKDYRRLTNSKTGKFTRDSLAENKFIGNIENKINKLGEEVDATVILSFLDNIYDALANVYSNSTIKGNNLSADYIANIDLLLQVSSYIDDIKQLLDTVDADFAIDGETREELLQQVRDAEKEVHKVRDFHEMATKRHAIQLLAKNSNFMEGLWREKFELEARREHGLTKPGEIQEHIFRELKKNKDFIETKEYEYWTNLLQNGYTDIRKFEYLFADPGMNKSQFVQVVKNILDKTDQDSRMELDQSISEIVGWNDKLEFIKKSGSPEKIWGKFLEEARYLDMDGKKVTFTDASVIPEFTSVYREATLKYKFKLDYLERERIKALSENKSIKLAKIEKEIEDIREAKQKELTTIRKMKDDAGIKLKVHPRFAKLTAEEQEALRFIHKKLEESDNRLLDAPLKKLVFNAQGALIYNLPRKRMSSLEAGYSLSKSVDRWVSGIKDLFRPPEDEDEMNVSKEEVDDNRDFKTNNTDILGNPLYDIPVFYRNQLEDPTLQSFDIPSLLAYNEETTIMYHNSKLVEADLFNITNALKIVESKDKVHKTDSVVSNNVVDKINKGFDKILKSEDNLVRKAVEASINNRFYKRTYNGVYNNTHYKLIKAGEAIGKYTSMLLLSGNFASASMTGIQGTVYRFIEGIAGEDFTLGDVKTGSRKAWADVRDIMADSQRQFPKSKTMLLIRRFGLETQYKALTNKFIQKNFATKNLDEGAMFAVTTIAETMVTANLMYTLMNNMKVMNSEGKFINAEGKVVSRKEAMSLDEAYDVNEDGVLVLNKHVSYTDKNLTSPLRDNLQGEKTIAATEISGYIRSKYADLYGQYNQDMKSVAEMNVWGKLAFSMRKWLPRGMHRRWRGIFSVWNTFDDMRDPENMQKRFYSQDQKKFQEGYYTTGLRWIYTVIQDMKLKQLNFMAAMKNVNTSLTTHERANLKRLGAELAVIAVSIAAALLATVVALNMDDDDEAKDAVYFAAYLAERIKVESLTFASPFELLDNIKNPAAAINSINRTAKLLENLFGVAYNKELDHWDWEINNVYERGPRKGDLKVWRNIQNLTPWYKKVSQAKGILGYDSQESIEDSYQFLAR